MSKLVEFLKSRKKDFAPTETYQHQGGYCSTCWHTEDVQVNDLDMDALYSLIEEFEASFQAGGENSHRNPLNKE